MKQKKEPKPEPKLLTAQPVGERITHMPVKEGSKVEKNKGWRRAPSAASIISTGNGCYRRMPTCKD
jgi:hypothetical protein